MSKKNSGRFSIFQKKHVLSDDEINRKISELAKLPNVPEFPGEITARNASRGKVKITFRTKNHVNYLKSLGYNSIESDGYVYTECNGFIDQCNLFDLPSIAKEGKLLHYRSKVTFPDGSTKYSITLCDALDKWSCLVMEPTI
jgi:hypothetical protein